MVVLVVDHIESGIVIKRQENLWHESLSQQIHQTPFCDPQLGQKDEKLAYLYNSSICNKYMTSINIETIVRIQSLATHCDPIRNGKPVVKNKTIKRDTKVVSFISKVHSSHGGGTVTRKRKSDGTVTKIQLSVPMCVSGYNNIEPINHSNQMRKANHINTKSRKWWLQLFLFLLDVTMVNSYLIYSQWFATVNYPPNRKQTPVTHLLFRTEVTDGLVNNFSVQCQLGPVPGLSPPQ